MPKMMPGPQKSPTVKDEETSKQVKLPVSDDEEPPPPPMDSPPSESDTSGSDSYSVDSVFSVEEGEVIHTAQLPGFAQADSSASPGLHLQGPLLECDNARAAIYAAKVERWRHEHRLSGDTNDTNFAYYFASYDEAKASAGTAVAQAWRDVRALTTPGIYLRAAAVVAEEKKRAAPTVPLSTPSNVQSSKKRKITFKARTRTEDIAPQVSNTPNLGFAQTLIEIQTMLSVQLLQRDGTPMKAADVAKTRKDPDFLASITRRAMRLCAPEAAEALTLKRATDTWTDLLEHAADHEYSLDAHMESDNVVEDFLLNMTTAQLESFVFGAAAPARVHASLKWLGNNLAITLPTEKIQAHKARAADPFGVQANQKASVELLMISKLEDAIIQKFTEGELDVLGNVSQWVQAVSGVRLKHLKLSFPVQLSGSLLKCWCIKGKQRGKREGFRFAIPAYFISHPSFCWAQRFLKLYRERQGGPIWGMNEKIKIGMIFNPMNGESLTNQACIDSTRLALSDFVDNIQDMSSLSWRRAGTSLVAAARYSAEDKLAYGDWQDRQAAGEEGKRLTMPIRYSDDKAGQAEKVKISVYVTYKSIIHYGQWSKITESTWSSLLSKPELVNEVDTLIAQNSTILWQLPEDLLPSAFQRKGFNLTDATGQVTTILEAPAEVKPPMPLVRDRILVAHTKNGKPLCPHFQVGKCKQGERCIWLHQCAIALRGGQACGLFNHCASDCRNKRAFVNKGVERIPLQAPAAQTDPALPASSRNDPVGEPSPDTTTRRSVTLPMIDTSHYSRIFDDLASQRFARPGHSGKPEPPSIICKILDEGGILLSGMPTSTTQEQFAAFKNITLQVFCFKQEPYKRKGRSEPGIQLPHAKLMRLNMDSYTDACAEFEPVMEQIASTVLAGEWVDVHCAAGIHRAATAMVPIRAAIHNETIEQAKQAISSVRAVELGKAHSHFVRGNWHGGDVNGWLQLMADKATTIWAAAKSQRGVDKLGVTAEGDVVHLIKIPEGSYQQGELLVGPRCQYNQRASNPKSLFGPESTITTASGVAAAAEAVTWTFVKGHLRLCATCKKAMPAGMITTLANGSIE